MIYNAFIFGTWWCKTLTFYTTGLFDITALGCRDNGLENTSLWQKLNSVSFRSVLYNDTYTYTYILD